MTYAQADVWSKKLTSYFGKGYESELVTDIMKWSIDYDDADMQRIYLQLKLDIKKCFKVDIRSMHAAANQLGILKRATAALAEALQGETITCTICGTEYEYNRFSPCVAFNGPVCSCHICGWYHHWDEDYYAAGRPEAGQKGTIGPGYHAKLKQWTDDLDARKRRIRDAKRADFDAQREKEIENLHRENTRKAS
jgi:hypothetical protein